MAFVYWGGEDAVARTRQLDDKVRDGKYGLTLWELKCLESVCLPQLHQEVAHHLPVGRHREDPERLRGG